MPKKRSCLLFVALPSVEEKKTFSLQSDQSKQTASHIRVHDFLFLKFEFAEKLGIHDKNPGTPLCLGAKHASLVTDCDVTKMRINIKKTETSLPLKHAPL